MFEVAAPGKYMDPSLYTSAKGLRVTAGTEPPMVVVAPADSTIAYDSGF